MASIAQLHQDCVSKLEFLALSTTIPPHPDGIILQDELDRYILWASNVGAHHHGVTYSLSLDYRLREAPFYQEQVLKLINLLHRHLNKIEAMLDNTTSSLEITESESDLEDWDNTSLDDVDSSWDISSDSGSEMSPAKPEMRPEVSPMHEPHSLEERLGAILASIHHTTTCLYQLPLRRPAPMARTREQAAEYLGFYQHFDTLHVRDKFPRISETLSLRLGTIITKRRQLLLYRKHHQENLQQDISAEPKAPAQLPKPVIKKSERLPSSSKSVSPSNAPSQAGRSQGTLPSKATTLRTENISEVKTPESGPATSIAASEGTRNLRLCIPPPLAPPALQGPRSRFFLMSLLLSTACHYV
ncbi:hypothetical protein BCR34DRAFT_604318 [Clohesyomyces aquaticus]|uniref:Uncharacterized protein n=1 Tax=Clohesyomyces aquaticus TaxID=1231657 RepID=A0A1Y1Z8K6_9PLEO|nr:hypothetical protein BCR34DRAFT_604318 [Clohesyomyces aquaticus]